MVRAGRAGTESVLFTELVPESSTLPDTQQVLSEVLHTCLLIWLIEGHLEPASTLLLFSCHQPLLFWS